MIKNLKRTVAFATSISALTVACAQSQEPIDYRALYERGATYTEFLGAAKARKELWDKNTASATVADDVVARARAIGGQLRILVIAIDGCSDSVSTIPYLAKLSELAGIELRIIPSEKGRGRAILEAHRTPDGRAATPTVVLLNETYENVGVWVERPAALRTWYDAKKYSVETAELTRRKMEWYAAARGASALNEIVLLMEKIGDRR